MKQYPYFEFGMLWEETDEVRDAQLAILKHLGYVGPEPTTRTEASKIITRYALRRRNLND